jgi:hypothetical protein
MPLKTKRILASQQTRYKAKQRLSLLMRFPGDPLCNGFAGSLPVARVSRNRLENRMNGAYDGTICVH